MADMAALLASSFIIAETAIVYSASASSGTTSIAIASSSTTSIKIKLAAPATLNSSSLMNLGLICATRLLAVQLPDVPAKKDAQAALAAVLLRWQEDMACYYMLD
jgi:hypothetical protein